MNSRTAGIVWICLVLLIAAAGWFLHSPAREDAATAGGRQQSLLEPESEPAVSASGQEDATERKESAASESEIERLKEMDRENMRKLRTGIFAYRERHGDYPEYLSQLVPEFVSAEALRPARRIDLSDNILASDHPDPGSEQPAYGYEFSNPEFRDGRTFAGIKEVQRSEWGDVVPLLRCFGELPFPTGH